MTRAFRRPWACPGVGRWASCLGSKGYGALILRSPHERFLNEQEIFLASRKRLSDSGVAEVRARVVAMDRLVHGIRRRLLRKSDHAIAKVAERAGYRSVSAFSTAFSRYIGLPPGSYSRGYPGVCGVARPERRIRLRAAVVLLT